MSARDNRRHEVAFCADVSKWADKLFEANLALPFGSSDIESFGRGSQKRQDFRVYERSERGRGRIALCGEVKLPGTAQGRSPFDPALMTDAFTKATNENCRYFFTWNVEHLALFDRSLWDADTMHERCVGQWRLGLELNHPTDVARAEVTARIRDEFLPRFFSAFADIYSGRKKEVAPPQDFYIAVLESHLAGPMGPVRELRDYLALRADRDPAFDARLREWMLSEQQWNFNRADPISWRAVVDRAARSMVYVLSNRILFYQAVRLRNYLPELRLPARAKKDPQKALDYLRDRFQEAVDKTGDYEPVFFPEDDDWAALIALSGSNSLEAWDRTISAIERFNFKEIPTDILGHTFQQLISPEERHKFGQHYTDETIVDLINAFCIRRADDRVLDPACGSGSFLVRAYYRKAQLDKRLTNQELLEGIYGCDINPFPAHLATLNLAARNIANEENYPRVAHRNFFTVAPGKTFCELPAPTGPYEGRRARRPILLPTLDAVIGNPPYVRYQDVPKASDPNVIREQTREHLLKTVAQAWPGLKLSGQSDLHVYFWPVAAQFLSDKGWLGFLTSSSWLDAKYGFALQRWLLLHFRLVAVIESVSEPWFEDARVKTVATLVQRCADERQRDTNLVRFIRLKRPLVEILGVHKDWQQEREKDERQRQEAAEELRDLLLRHKSDFSDDRLRIMMRRQSDLWHEGLSVAEMFARQKALAGEEMASDGDEGAAAPTDRRAEQASIQAAGLDTLDYGGGKWGRYLRAPDFYFEIMREYGERFTRLGEIAAIKYGILSGCDAFFMPHDVSAELLRKNPSAEEWRALPLMRRCKRDEVESGEVLIVECGDGTLHPIEASFARLEVHSLMQVDRPTISPAQLDRVVLWVDRPLEEIKGSYAYHFIKWGSKQTFASKKSKSVPVPEREGCAGRSVWYDLTGREVGIGFWPMAQQYRHIIPANPAGLICNHNLFAIHALGLARLSSCALMPILNSTVVAFVKPFYGRYAGTEGNLKTEVVDTLLIEVPDPRNVTEPLLRRMEEAFASMQRRKVTHLVEEAFLDCHTAEEVREAAKLPLGLPAELQQEDRRELDDTVFELLGVTSAGRRQELIEQLYREVARHYRDTRVIEVQKMEQRRGGGGGKVSSLQLALSAWDELEPDWQKPLAQWLEEQADGAKVVSLPDGDVRLPEAHNFLDAATIYFGKQPPVAHVCDSRSEAELLAAIAQAGLRGPVSIPRTEKECARLAQSLEARLTEGKGKLEEIAKQYAGAEKLREQVLTILTRWFLQGKPE
ncbi:MAG TPA: N-6 DNA methylase [Pyrinomonadaceae bacterium]|jgi:methylase of polypeptide subunit release factors